jgi:hypothetical protein
MGIPIGTATKSLGSAARSRILEAARPVRRPVEFVYALRKDTQDTGAWAFKEKKIPEWPNHGL